MHAQNAPARWPQTAWLKKDRDAPSLDRLLENKFFKFAQGRKHDTENHNWKSDNKAQRIYNMPGNEDKNDKSTGNKA